MQFQMLARIDSSEFHNQRYYTVVTTPAPDAFSHPARFKVQSQQPIGQVGQNLKLTVAVSGIVRERPYRDKQTGQQKVFQEGDVYLNVVTSEPAVIPEQRTSPQQQTAKA